MYKIYFGERYLLITDKGINNYTNVFEFHVIDDLKQFVVNFDEKSCESSAVIIDPNPQKVFEKLIHLFKYIEAAGGIVVNDDDELLLIYRLNKWDLPKGKIEKNELIETCAIREIEEECGIHGHLIKRELCSTYHTYHDKKQLCIKQTYWFELSYSGIKKCKPQIEEDISQVLWVKTSELQQYLSNTYPSVIDVITKLSV